MITLYDCASAPSPRRARILLAEKGVMHDTVQIDLKLGEQLGEAYRKINPQCTVPALRTKEGVMLTSNAAIAAYLEARYPQPPMLGVTPLDKAEIADWHWRIEFEGFMPIAEAFRNTSAAMQNRALPGPVNYAQIPQLAERGVARLQQFLLDLNEQIQDRDFIAAQQFSIADIAAVVTIDFARIVKVRLNERHPNLLRWREAMAQRPAMTL
jgi:glutathione S-transferase